MNSRGGVRPQVFVILTGVSGNLGDAVIRRRVLHWSRQAGDIHAYVGRTTPGWIEQLGFREDEQVYAAGDRGSWLRKLIFGRGKRVLIFDPGEVPLGREHLKSELVFLAVVALVRMRGGRVVRPPRAIAHYDPTTAAVYRASARLSQAVLWRDKPSLDRMNVGELTPDTAFAEPKQDGRPKEERRTLLVTMRGRRPIPSDAWFAGITQFALENDHRIVTMSQVDEDEDRSKELASRFPDGLATHIPWGTRTDLEQEKAVRSLYEECVMVVSDRLHVLILSAQAGSIPVELAPKPAPKVGSHFGTIGYDGVSLDTAERSAGEIASFLTSQSERGEELAEKLNGARNDLNIRILEALPAAS